MPPLPFFFWSDYGSTLFLAKRFKQDGHTVLLYIRDPASQAVGTGIVPKTTTPIPPWSRSVVLFDGVGHGGPGTELRRRGHFVIGGNPLDMRLEADRAEGTRLMRAHGIRTPDTHEFRDVDRAIRFLDDQEGHWFVKASGRDTPENSTYDAPVDELQRYLRFLKGSLEHFQLSSKVTGTEISTNGWFDGQDFVPPFDVTLEEKKFLTGDLGPRTGCESNLVWMAQDQRLAEQTVQRLRLLLAAERYVGPIDLNARVQQDGDPIGLEWTARLGFDATQAWSRLFDQTLGEQLESFAAGDLDHWEVSDALAVTLRVSMPPYPLWDSRIAQKSKGMPLDPQWLTHPDVTIDDVMRGPDGPVMAGRDGSIGTVGAIGTDLDTLKRDVLTLAKSLRVPNKQHRIDPLSRATRDLKALTATALVGHKALAAQFKGAT